MMSTNFNIPAFCQGMEYSVEITHCLTLLYFTLDSLMTRPSFFENRQISARFQISLLL